MMDEKVIKEKLEVSISTFLRLHKKLIEVDANERSMTHKFAECLTPLFPEWDVDCEYNRDGYEPKRIGLDPQPIQSNDEQAHTVFPDIIIHHRGKTGRENNLLVIEAKKNADQAAEESDGYKVEREL